MPKSVKVTNQVTPLSLEEKNQMKDHLRKHRRVILFGTLNGETIGEIGPDLLRMDFENNQPITLILQSSGGEVVPTQQFGDVISTLNSPVDVVALGDCSSMAVDLMQMCRKRYVLPATRILVHYIRNNQQWIADDPNLLETDMGYFKERLQEIRKNRFDLYKRRTGLPIREIKRIFRHGEVHNASLSAKQAVNLGFADQILTDFKFFPKTKS